MTADYSETRNGVVLIIPCNITEKSKMLRVNKGSRYGRMMGHGSKEIWRRDDGPYLETKRIHSTQRYETNEYGESIVTLRLYQSRELVSLLLSYGKDVTVLEPESLRQEMKKIIGEMTEGYN
jgi:predicted DNA-binding transcriptional regulator YafY